MSQHRTGKKFTKAAFPEVVNFAACLDHVIKDRMSENRLNQVMKVGKSKLIPYLEGVEVPDERVLEYYFVKPLNDFRALTEDEHATLRRLHQDACRVQAAKSPTMSDRVNFLEEDLAAARTESAELTARLDIALSQNVTAGADIAQLKRAREDLRVQVQELMAYVSVLQRELDKSTAHQAELEEASRELDTLDRELDACHQKISTLETALSDHVATSIELQKAVHHQDLMIRNLEQQQSDERRLFMELVNHVGSGAVVDRMSETIMRQTEIIMNLTETNKALELERDLLAQEREFARAVAPAAPVTEPAPRLGPMQSISGDTVPMPLPDVPDVPAAAVPQPREPQEQRHGADVADSSSPDVMGRARAQFSTAPTGSDGHPDRLPQRIPGPVRQA